MKLLAIMPARTGSKRLPNKNFMPFFGRKMCGHALLEIEKSDMFAKVIISTDLPEKRREPFTRNVFMWEERPSYLCTDIATVDEVCLDISKRHQGYDYFCVVYPCAYAVTAEHLINSFLKMVKENKEYCYSYGMLNSIADYQCDNGGFYWCNTEAFLRDKSFIHKDTIRYELPQVDINTFQDFLEAKLDVYNNHRERFLK